MTQIDASFELLQDGNVSVLVLLPELNNVQWGDIDAIGTEVLNSMSTQKNPYIIVDLSPLNYMGSAMVALIVRVWKAAQAKDGKISVVCPHDGVREVLKLASLDKVWSIVNTREEARSALGLRGSSSLTSTDNGNSSKSNAGWIVAGILLVICAGLAVIALNPGIINNEVVSPEIPVPASTSSVVSETGTSETALEEITDTVEENNTEESIPEEEMTSSEPAEVVPTPVETTNPAPVATTNPVPEGTSNEESTGNPFAPPGS